MSDQNYHIPSLYPVNPESSQAFPVGSVFISVISTAPDELLGYGTWEAFGDGRVLVGLDPGNPSFDSPEEIGGSLQGTPGGTNSAPIFTGDALPGHTHGTGSLAVSSHVGSSVADHAAHTHSVTSNVAVADHAAHTHSVTSNVAVADHAAHTHTYTDVPNHTHPHNMQGNTTGATTGTNVMGSTATGGSARAMAIATSNPTGGVATGTTTSNGALTHGVTNNAVTTGNPSAVLSHGVTNNAVTSGNPSAILSHSVTNNAVTSGNPSAVLSHGVTQPDDHALSGVSGSASAGTPGGSVSAPVFAGDPLSLVQPYIVCYFWRRTA